MQGDTNMTEYRILEMFEEIKTLIMGKPKQEKWIGIKEASEYCGVSTATLRRNVKSNKLKASKSTGKMLFKASELEQWLKGF